MSEHVDQLDSVDSIRGGIAVGVDGSAQSKSAALWAAEEARLRNVPLHLISAYTLPVFAATSIDPGYAEVDDAAMNEAGKQVLDEAAQLISGIDVQVSKNVVAGDATTVLLDLSKQVELIVVGSRGRAGFIGRLLGTVSSALPGHAKCPTVVTPLSCAQKILDEHGAGASGENKNDAEGDNTGKGADAGAESAAVSGEGTSAVAAGEGRASAPKEQRIVVGVDGSDDARFAALAAAEEAVLRGASLHLVCALPPFSGSYAWMPTALDRDEILADLHIQLDAGKRWLQHHFPALTIVTNVVDGPPIEVLVEQSEKADLTVVGSRGLGGFAGMILGSTSQAVLHHAKGPLMVVPDKEDPRLADRGDFGPILHAM